MPRLVERHVAAAGAVVAAIQTRDADAAGRPASGQQLLSSERPRLELGATEVGESTGDLGSRGRPAKAVLCLTGR